MLEALEGKLKGLYEAARDEEAFDNLALDKQQALMLLMHRLQELGLWRYVRRVENVYGVGGVGMNFSAWPELASALRSRKDFTTRFARHRDNQGGFVELGRATASLHFLYVDRGDRRWAVHFDLYNPWSSPASAFRHLFYEKLKGVCPDWRAIRKALVGFEGRF
jgi:hypothetical protein